MWDPSGPFYGVKVLKGVPIRTKEKGKEKEKGRRYITSYKTVIHDLLKTFSNDEKKIPFQ